MAGWTMRRAPSARRRASGLAGVLAGALVAALPVHAHADRSATIGTPLDLDVNVLFSDADIDSSGANSALRTYAANGGARVYLGDTASFRLGADYTRVHFGQTSHVESILATMDLEILLPTERNVVIGGGFIVGDRTESSLAFQTFGRLVFGISLNATVSFTGAETLAELRRNFF